MNPFQPKPTMFDVRWRMFGIGVRIHPLFWIISPVFVCLCSPQLAQNILQRRIMTTTEMVTLIAVGVLPAC